MLETPSVLTKQIDRIPKIAIGILFGVLLFGMFIIGYDQGQLFSLVQGQKAFDDMWMHEFYHDLRHAAGFPCH
jgi:Probable cobalt transporter subunit (CbtB)